MIRSNYAGGQFQKDGVTKVVLNIYININSVCFPTAVLSGTHLGLSR